MGGTRKTYCPENQEARRLQEEACCQWCQMLQRNKQEELESAQLVTKRPGFGVLGVKEQVRRN